MKKTIFVLFGVVSILSGCLSGQPRGGGSSSGGGGGGDGVGMPRSGAGNPRPRTSLKVPGSPELPPLDGPSQFSRFNFPFDSQAQTDGQGSFGGAGLNEGNFEGEGHVGPGQLPGGRPIATNVMPDAKGLNRSGEGGNPSFSYSVRNYRDGNSVPMGQCQGTLTRKENGICAFATAAHCLVDAEDASSPTPPPKRFGVTGLDKKSQKVITLTAPDFGAIQALAVINPDYVRENNITGVSRTPTGINVQTTHASKDIAMVYFKGEACEKTEAETVPLTTQCPSGQFKIGSRWQRRSFFANPLQFLADSIRVFIEGAGIKQGDSGGGYFCVADGKAVGTIGVLSTGGGEDSKNRAGYWNEATYSAREATDWAMKHEASFFEQGKGTEDSLPNTPSAAKPLAEEKKSTSTSPQS